MSCFILLHDGTDPFLCRLCSKSLSHHTAAILLRRKATIFICLLSGISIISKNLSTSLCQSRKSSTPMVSQKNGISACIRYVRTLNQQELRIGSHGIIHFIDIEMLSTKHLNLHTLKLFQMTLINTPITSQLLFIPYRSLHH